MTINKVIERVRAVKADALDAETKGRWLLDLEGRLYQEVVLTHEGAGADPSTAPEERPGHPRAYRWPDDGDEPLVAEEPYDRLYEHYLASQIDLYYQDMDSYNQQAALFNAALDQWRVWYHQRHRPISAGYYRGVM